jgi:hypothetical protein
MSAAEIAMMVRFTEDPDMFIVPFTWRSASRGSLLNSIQETCQAQ